jgi:hypothetical protein
MTKTFVSLKNTDFNKDENRGNNFLKKIKEGSKFSTVAKGDVTIPKIMHDEVMVFLQAVDGKYPERGTSMILMIS